MTEEKKLKEFERDLADLINRHSLEGETNTPNFRLAAFLVDCLKAYNVAVRPKLELEEDLCQRLAKYTDSDVSAVCVGTRKETSDG